MIEQNTVKFLQDLSVNNNRDWFADNRKVYEAARDNFIAFIDDLIPDLQNIDPFITDVNAKNAVFRIFKDIRFSKKKEPYKTSFGAAIGKGGRKSEYPGYYLHIKPDGETFVGGGIHHPQPAILKSIRSEIAHNTKQFEEIINDLDFLANFGELEGDKLIRPPKGFDKEHPAVEHLKRKDFLMLHKIPDSKICHPDFKTHCLGKFERMKPLNEYFRGPVYDILENND